MNSCKVAHAADIHIRGLSRHDEIRTVVEAFCDDVQKQDVDYIVLAGDIFHTKCNGITSEYFELLTWMCLKMVSACRKKLIVTLGNHDGALTNISRQDAVSPVINAMQHPDIILYKESGTFELEENLYISVFSVFDTDWKKVQPVEGAFNIAVYHGPVSGAKTETGWDLESNVSVAWFEKYKFDIVLLGDIHKRQFLGYRQEISP